MTRHIEENREPILEEALEQFIESQLWGDKSDIDELLRQYPQYEHQIKLRLRKIQRIDALFDTLIQPDERDFEDMQTEQKLVGQKVGSFQIIELIGRGGMGVVYRAQDTKLKRSVAVKSVPPKWRTDLNAKARFKREAELLASLNHPNIAVIYDIIEQDESAVYLILEYVPGETLAQRIAREPLRFQETLSIGQQIVEAVSAAHKKDIVHRDLKPSNIKITPEGRIKVLDFGLAKPFAREGECSEITETQPGRVIGTPAYMSPEQARGNETDYRTDIWSFGCMMYQMLTGRLPFESETAAYTLERIIEHEPDWEALPKETPSNIRSLLRCCLEKDPNQRLGNIADASIEINGTLRKVQMKSTTKLRKIRMILSAAIIVVLFAIALRFLPGKQTQPSSSEIRLVVLPFENLGADEDDYFANGITDEITARLAGIHGLSVISRQSAMQYKHSEKGAPQIGEELGVDYLLEGTVQWEQPSDPTSRVRIIPQLIRASDDAHVWAQTYDDDMSEVFRAQSHLAERIAEALGITLLEPERQAFQFEPTKNMEAYAYYLRGQDYYSYRDLLKDDYKLAIGMYEKAVELDPNFALVYARLSDAHSDMYWMFYDRSKERLAMAKQAVDKAFQLNSHLPEAHIALGHYYYHGFLDYERALEQFEIARKSRPNSGEVLGWIAYVQRRQGKFEQALANFKRAFELDPLCNPLAFDIAQTFMILRKYPEAENYYDRAISLAPDLLDPYSWKARLYLRWQGSTRKANAVLEEALQNPKSTDNAGVVNTLINIDVFDANYQGALDRLSLNPPDVNDQHYFLPNALRYALIHEYMGNHDLSEKYYEEARGILENKIQGDPNDTRFHSSLGIAYAGLGRKEDAIREGKLAVKLLPVSQEAWRGLNRIEDLVRIYTMVGEYNLAVDQLEYLLSIPGEISIPLLQLDPAWAPLRNQSFFKRLVDSNK
jgi:serine/threonine protein kinase/tetratricopeptide (TPR) repeat protein